MADPCNFVGLAFDVLQNNAKTPYHQCAPAFLNSLDKFVMLRLQLKMLCYFNGLFFGQSRMIFHEKLGKLIK